MEHWRAGVLLLLLVDSLAVPLWLWVTLFRKDFVGRWWDVMPAGEPLKVQQRSNVDDFWKVNVDGSECLSRGRKWNGDQYDYTVRNPEGASTLKHLEIISLSHHADYIRAHNIILLLKCHKPTLESSRLQNVFITADPPVLSAR